MGRVYAIDLGVTGAIATFDSGHLLAVDYLVITGCALCADWLTDYIAGVQRDTIVCESVHAMPTGTKANFSMGLQLGVVIGVAGAALSKRFATISSLRSDLIALFKEDRCDVDASICCSKEATCNSNSDSMLASSIWWSFFFLVVKPGERHRPFGTSWPSTDMPGVVSQC